MRRLLACVVLALVAPGLALGARGDPQNKPDAADQARAKAMLLRKSDLPGFTRSGSGSDSPSGYCTALDESDLTVTAQARSPSFTAGATFVSSESSVYESVADASASWRRGTSAAGQRCLRTLVGKEFAKQNVRLVSLRKTPFPHVARRTALYRVVLSGAAQGIPVKVVVDVIALSTSRAQAFVYLGAAFAAPARGAELRLARLVAGRMSKAMQGA